MKKNIPPLDLLFYLMETHDNPKHVACVQIFQMPAGVGDNYLIELVEKLRRIPAQEPFNFKPVFPRVGMPQWHSVENMEMEYHLRHSALPKPGNMKQLLKVVQRLHVGILDHERPGWICQVIEGLEGNRFAIYYKIHHAYIDGMSAVKRIYGALSLDPADREPQSIWGYKAEAAGKGKGRKRAGGQLRELGKAARAQVKGIGQLNKQILDMSMEMARMREHSGHIPFQAPRTRINDPVESDLRSMGITSLPIEQLMEIGRQAGCKLNDVVLAVVDAGLHDYLARHDDDPDQPLVAMCPMALRDAHDDAANTQVTTLFVEMGQPGVSPRERLGQVAQSSSAAKREARKLSKEGLMDFAMLFGVIGELAQRTGLDRVLPQSYNVLVSNVPGPRTEDMYLMGSRMEAIYPITTLIPGNNLNITVLSHGSRLDVGMLAARGTLPDIEYLVESVGRQFQALAAEFGVGTATRRKAAKKSAPKKAAAARPKTRAGVKTGVTVKAKPKPKARAGAKS